MRRLLAVAGILMVGVACASGDRAPEDPSFLTIHRVVQQLPPETCGAPDVPSRDATGKVISCYRVDPPDVDAGVIQEAKAVQDRATGAWEVEFQLTDEGTRRWNEMAARAGPGHAVAVVVDGTVVSTTSIERTAFAGRGWITGDFGKADAERLAKRLDRG